MTVSGVFSSCETLAIKSDRMRSSRVNRVTSRTTNKNPVLSIEQTVYSSIFPEVMGEGSVMGKSYFPVLT